MRRVVVADRQEAARGALGVLIDATDDLLLVAEAADAQATLAAVRRTRPDAVVVDARLRTPDGRPVAGVIAAERDAAGAPVPRVLVLATFGDPEEVGPPGNADRLLLRDAGADVVIGALRDLASPPPALSASDRNPRRTPLPYR